MYLGRDEEERVRVGGRGGGEGDGRRVAEGVKEDFGAEFGGEGEEGERERGLLGHGDVDIE